MENITLMELFNYVSDITFKFSQIDTSYSSGTSGRREPFFDMAHATITSMVKMLTPEQKESLSEEMKNSIRNARNYAFKHCSLDYKSSIADDTLMV